MNPLAFTENGMNWDDDQIDYDQLETAVSKAVADYAHIYSNGISKCRFLKQLLGLPVHNLEDFGCPEP